MDGQYSVADRIMIDTNSPDGVVEGQRLELSYSQEAYPGPDITSITWSDNTGSLSSTEGVLSIGPRHALMEKTHVPLTLVL